MCRKELVLANAQSYGPQQKAGGGNQTAQSHVGIAQRRARLVAQLEREERGISTSKRRGRGLVRSAAEVMPSGATSYAARKVELCCLPFRKRNSRLRKERATRTKHECGSRNTR